jgi:hypothetical protein
MRLVASTLRRGGRKYLARQRGGFQNLLEVVEHQEQPLVLQVVLDAFKEWLVRAFPDTEYLRHAGSDQRGVGEGGECYEEDAVLELFEQVRSRLQRQAALTRPARTGEGKEPHLGSQKPPSDVLHLSLAAN